MGLWRSNDLSYTGGSGSHWCGAACSNCKTVKTYAGKSSVDLYFESP